MIGYYPMDSALEKSKNNLKEIQKSKISPKSNNFKKSDLFAKKIQKIAENTIFLLVLFNFLLGRFAKTKALLVGFYYWGLGPPF